MESLGAIPIWLTAEAVTIPCDCGLLLQLMKTPLLLVDSTPFFLVYAPAHIRIEIAGRILEYHWLV